MNKFLRYGISVLMILMIFLTTVSCKNLESDTENNLGDAVESTLSAQFSDIC